MKNKYIREGLKATGIPRFWNGLMLVVLLGGLLQMILCLVSLSLNGMVPSPAVISLIESAFTDLGIVLAMLAALWLLGLSKAVDRLEAV